MKNRLNVMILASLILLVVVGNASAQRGRGGFGGGRGSIGAGGGVSAGALSTYNGGGTRTAGTRTTGSYTGPMGGSGTASKGSGSYTTQRGGTIEYAGAGAKGSTPGGVNYGRGVGGVQVTTAGGKELTKVGTVGGVAGPGGNAAVSRGGITTGSGPGGSFTTAYKGGVAVGPQGAVAGGARVGTATGAAGTVSGASRWGAAAGPYGAAAYRGGVAVGPGGVAVGGTAAAAHYGTYYRSTAVITAQGASVRYQMRQFAQDYPVLTARWIGPTWRPITWAALSSYASYPAEPVSYDYGDSVVYQDNSVIVNGESVGTPEQYSQQASDLVDTGKEAKTDPKPEEWQSLGVFAMVGEGETNSTNIFQISVNKDGVIQGEYYNALTDETSPIAGSVDKKTQRAAWAAKDRKYPVYEAGIANLTKDETSMLVHFSKEKAKQFTLVRIPPPQGDQPEAKK